LQVLIPIGPTGSTVDVWIVVNSRPVSVQVKRAWITKGGRYSVRAARRGTKNIPEKVYKAGDFDILAAYLPDRNQFVLWRFDEIKQRKKISYTPRLHRQPDNWDLLDTVLK
jgi:hypothetical protein